jgi:hypothetical protein
LSAWRKCKLSATHGKKAATPYGIAHAIVIKSNRLLRRLTIEIYRACVGNDQITV